jgi:hypothetical protein
MIMSSKTKEQTQEQIAPTQPVVRSPEDPDGVQPHVQDALHTSRVPSHTRVVIELSPKGEDMLKSLMDQTGDSPSDLFRKALSLYKVASDSHRNGMAVGAATSPDSLEAEFTGF